MQPGLSLCQPIDLAVRFALRELPAKCRPRTQLKLGYHGFSPAWGKSFILTPGRLDSLIYINWQRDGGCRKEIS
jgi:hypothetical protein